MTRLLGLVLVVVGVAGTWATASGLDLGDSSAAFPLAVVIGAAAILLPSVGRSR